MSVPFTCAFEWAAIKMAANTGWCSGLAHHRNLVCYYRPSVGFPGWLTGAWRPGQACLGLLTVSPFPGTQEGSHHCSSNWLCMLLSTVTGWRRGALEHAIKKQTMATPDFVNARSIGFKWTALSVFAGAMAPHLARAADGVSEKGGAVVPSLRCHLHISTGFTHESILWSI